jgi:hypothetical protein
MINQRTYKIIGAEGGGQRAEVRGQRAWRPRGIGFAFHRASREQRTEGGNQRAEGREQLIVIC